MDSSEWASEWVNLPSISITRSLHFKKHAWLGGFRKFICFWFYFSACEGALHDGRNPRRTTGFSLPQPGYTPVETNENMNSVIKAYNSWGLRWHLPCQTKLVKFRDIRCIWENRFNIIISWHMVAELTCSRCSDSGERGIDGVWRKNIASADGGECLKEASVQRESL